MELKVGDKISITVYGKGEPGYYIAEGKVVLIVPRHLAPGVDNVLKYWFDGDKVAMANNKHTKSLCKTAIKHDRIVIEKENGKHAIIPVHSEVYFSIIESYVSSIEVEENYYE